MCPLSKCVPSRCDLRAHHWFLLTSNSNLISSNLQDASTRCLEAKIGQKYSYGGERETCFWEYQWQILPYQCISRWFPLSPVSQSEWNTCHSPGHLSCCDDQQQSQCSDIFYFFPGLHIFFRASIFELSPSYLCEQQRSLLHICSWIHSFFNW